MAVTKAIIRNKIYHSTVDRTINAAFFIFFLKVKDIGYTKAIEPIIKALTRKIIKNIKPCVILIVTPENSLDRLFIINVIKCNKDTINRIILIYHFHLSKAYSLEVKPYMDNKLYGVFATRASARPNSIGLSVVRLIKVERNNLHIKDVDIVITYQNTKRNK